MSEPQKDATVSYEKQMVYRGSGNEPARVDMSLFDYTTPEVGAQKDKAGIFVDTALNVGFAILKRIMRKLRRLEAADEKEAAGETVTSKERGADFVASDAFKCMGAAALGLDVMLKLKKEEGEQNRQNLSKVYADREQLGRSALQEAMALQKGLMSKTQKQIMKEGERLGHAIQTEKTV